MKKKKIIFLSAQVISKRDYKRFGIDGIDLSCDLTILDFTKIMQPKAFNEQLKNKKKGIKSIVIEKLSDLLDLSGFLAQSDLIISALDSPNLLNYPIYEVFQKYQQMILSNKKSIINDLNSELNLKNPITKLNNMTGKVDAFSEKLNFMLNQKINNKKNDLDKLQKSINILNPLSILDRGYSIILNKKGSAIKSSMEVNKGENLKARLSKGTIDIEVK